MKTEEQIPADKLVKMTSFWHKAFNIAGCDPMCHCCEKMIKTNQYFKLSTVFEATDNCLHYYNDMSELQIKALKGEPILLSDLDKLKEDFWFEEKYKMAGGFPAIERLAKPDNKEVMLCAACTPQKYTEKQIKILENNITERDKPRGGCFRIDGKIVH